MMSPMEGNSVIEEEVEVLRIVNRQGYVQLIKKDMSQNESYIVSNDYTWCMR